MCPPADPLRRIESLRGLRVRPGRDQGVAELFRRTASELERAERSIGQASEAWRAVCPSDLLTRTSVVSLNRGVLTVGADSASTRYELDRMLRAGGERAVIRACRASVRKVKVVTAPPPASDAR